MKTLIKSIAASMVIAGSFAFSNAAFAQVETEDQDDMELQKQSQNDKVEVKIEEVPSPVTEAINADYEGWKASKAFKVTDADSQEVVYEIHFTNPQGMTEKKKFSAEGEEIEDYK